MRFVRRLFLILIAALAVYITFDIVRLYSGYRGFENVPPEYTAGPADADISVVEFLRYGCEYCRQAHATITAAVKKDGHIRYIPRPMASDDKQSTDAVRLAYAAGKQGKFIAMHNALIENYRVINDDILNELAAKTGADAAKLKADFNAEEMDPQIIENGQLYTKLGTGATPSFVIDRKIVYVPQGRMPTVDDFITMFDEARGR